MFRFKSNSQYLYYYNTCLWLCALWSLHLHYCQLGTLTNIVPFFRSLKVFWKYLYYCNTSSLHLHNCQLGTLTNFKALLCKYFENDIALLAAVFYDFKISRCLKKYFFYEECTEKIIRSISRVCGTAHATYFALCTEPYWPVGVWQFSTNNKPLQPQVRKFNTTKTLWTIARGKLKLILGE